MLHFAAQSSLPLHQWPTAIPIALLLLSQFKTDARADPPAPPRTAAARAADAALAKPANPPVRVTIAKETTYITEPLREDGYPDYLQYLNGKLSEGVTPENNAIVSLTQTMGLSDLDEKTRNTYCRLLGIEPLPENGDYFEPWQAYAARIPETDQPRVAAGDKRTQQE